MPFELNLDPSDLIIDRYIPDIRPIFPRPAKVRILIVLEPGISPWPTWKRIRPGACGVLSAQ